MSGAGPSRRRARAAPQVFTIVGFAALILAPAVDLVARPDVARSPLRENRRAAPWPDRLVDLTSLSRTPTQYESWFVDRLGLRDQLLRGDQALRYFVFDTEPSPTLIPGREGWLFFGADDSVRVHRGLAPMTRAELENWKTVLEAQREWCRDHGAEFVFAIAPNKQTVYPDLWPEHLAPVGPTRLDQFVDFMARESDVRCVDLRPTLSAERRRDSVEDGDYAYHPLGSHWTFRGGVAAWNAIVASLPPPFASRMTRPREMFRRVEFSDGLLDSMGLQTYVSDLLVQRNWNLEAIDAESVIVRAKSTSQIEHAEQDAPYLPSVLVVHDSFGPWFLRQVAPACRRLDAIWAHAFPKEAVVELSPEVVVQVYTERMLVWGIPPLSHDLEIVPRAAFDAFSPCGATIDVGGNHGLEAQGGVTLAGAAEGLAVEQSLENGVLLAPGCDVPSGSELAVRIEVTAPAHTRLLLFFQTRDEPTFSRRRSVSTTLEAGRNDVSFRVRVPDVTGPFKLRLGAEKGRYVLHALEARSAPGR